MDRLTLMNEVLSDLTNGRSLNGQTRLEFLRQFRKVIHEVVDASDNPTALTAQDVIWKIGEIIQRDPREVANSFLESK